MEIFNSVIPVESWKFENDIHYGDIEINNETFRIMVEYDKVLDKDVCTIGFAKMIDGKLSLELTIDSSNASKVLGAIINGAITKINEFPNVDIVVFAAEDNIEKRMRLYNNIAWKIMKTKGFNWMKKDVKMGNGLMTIISKSEFEDDIVDTLSKMNK
jgi:hypothetical protein